MNNSRRSAAFVFAKWLAVRDFPSDLLPQGPDRAFIQDLVYVTIRRLRPLRLVLGELVRTWPKGELEALLYVGAAQILYMEDVTDYAAVNETVAAAHECANPSIARVVNGVLRNLIRRRAELLSLVSAQSADVRESFPRELYRRWSSRFGAEKAEALARWHNVPAETFLAWRPTAPGAESRFEQLPRGRRVADVPGYGEGAFIVQDPATALAVSLVDAQPGERILDACAAPGGKTVQLAWRGAEVTACEVNPKRRARLEENLRRAGVKVEVTDALERNDGSGTRIRYPKVLVDAPCSNTGVLRRRPDARWNWSVAKLAELVKLQAEILDRAAGLVEPGGRLVYSTCSNEPEENLGQVEAFLARHGEFVLEESRESVPVESGTDGAFAAVLSRRDNKAADGE